MELHELEKKLFSEFPPVSTAEWEEKIKTDLKGADYEKKLIWKTDEGFSVKPYYRAEDLNDFQSTGYTDNINLSLKRNNDWIIREDISSLDVVEANRISLDAISKGAQAIGFLLMPLHHKKI